MFQRQGCAAFPDLRTFDGWHVNQFGCTKAEYEAKQQLEKQAAEDKWIADHLGPLSQHPAWPIIGHLQQYWFSADLNLEVCLAKLDKCFATRTKVRQELEGFTDFPTMTEEELLKCHDVFVLKSKMHRFLLQDLHTLVLDMDFTPPLSATIIQSSLSQLNISQPDIITAVKTCDKPQLKILCVQLFRKNVRARMKASFERWMRNRDFHHHGQVWKDAEANPTIFAAMLDPNMQFQHLPHLQELEERYPKLPPSRPQSAENTCACGQVFSTRCAQLKCGTCCTGPCPRHDSVLAKRRKL